MSFRLALCRLQKNDVDAEPSLLSFRIEEGYLCYIRLKPRIHGFAIVSTRFRRDYRLPVTLQADFR